MFQQAADWLGLESRKSLWGQFWSAHQRFFKYLCVAAKVRRLVELARQELARDKVGPGAGQRGVVRVEHGVTEGLGKGGGAGLALGSHHPPPSAWSSACSPRARRGRGRSWTRRKDSWTASSLLRSE